MRSFALCIAIAAALHAVPAAAASGTLAANPSPCAIPAGGGTCTTNFSWSSSGASGTQLWVVNTRTRDRGLVAASGPSGSTSVSWIPAYPGWEFELTDGSQVLDSKLVFGKTRANAGFGGGSFYQWFHVVPDVLVKDGQQFGEPWPYGIVVNYHRNPGNGYWVDVRAQVRSQLATMYGNGQRTLGLGLYHERGASETDTVVNSARRFENGTFVNLGAQMRANLANFLADVKAARFERISFAMFPLGSNSPGHCSNFDSNPAQWTSLATENRNMIREVRAILAAAGLPYFLDLGNEEGLSSFSPTCTRNYVTQTWNWYAQTYGNWTSRIVEDSVGFSMIVENTWRVDETLMQAATLYTEWVPAALNLHIYAQVPGAAPHVNQSAELVYTYAVQRAATFPKRLRDRPWIIGETHGESWDHAYSLSRGVAVSGKAPLFVLQWPTIPVNGNGQYRWLGPQLWFDAYSSYGF